MFLSMNFLPHYLKALKEQKIPKWYTDNEFIIKELKPLGKVRFKHLAKKLKGRVSLQDLEERVNLLEQCGVMIIDEIPLTKNSFVDLEWAWKE